jgi:caspase domain-containing protein
MFSNTVLKIHLCFILVLLFLMTGCTMTMTAPMVDVTLPPPAIVRKIPMKVAIVIPDEVENYTFTGEPQTPDKPAGDMETGFNVVMTFPVGQMLKKCAPEALSQIFEEAVLIKDGSYPEDIDAVVFPTIEGFQYWYTIINSSPFNAQWESHAKTYIKLTITDRKGMLLWEETLSSPQVKGKIFNPMKTYEFPEPSGKAAAMSVATAFRDAARKIAGSREIHAYASVKGKPETIISSKSVGPRTVAKSDVDDLPQVQAKSKKNAYSIVIGVEKYRQKLPKADFATHDAQTVTAYLTKVMGYPEENVVTLINDRALKSDFEKYFEKWLPNNIEKDSSVFIYYSGHGAPNPKTGDAYLVPYDGDPSFIEQTGYSLKRLYKNLNKLPANEIIVVLDSCFSGAGGRSVLAKGARPLVMNMDKQVLHSDRIAILSASSGAQISSTHEEKGHGLFTYFFLKGLKDGNSELGTLYNYLKPQVERIARKTYNNEQTPGLIAPVGLLNLSLYDR